VERQAVKARKSGYVAVKPEDEVPAGTPRGPLVSGPITRDTVDGKAHLKYGVASGDTLWSLSQRFDCNLESLKTWNHLAHKAKGLQIGTVLSIFPGPHATAVEERAGTLVAKSAEAAPRVVAASVVTPIASGPTPRTHLLAAGETLWSVSQKYGVSVDDLKKWNGIKKDRAVKAGQSLSLVSP
jgi:membrane-bound lytic murein transglycosylase D